MNAISSSPKGHSKYIGKNTPHYNQRVSVNASTDRRQIPFQNSYDGNANNSKNPFNLKINNTPSNKYALTHSNTPTSFSNNPSHVNVPTKAPENSRNSNIIELRSTKSQNRSKKNMIGPYVLKSKIGSGSMGSVRLGFDTRFNRHVAIKIISKQELNQNVLFPNLNRASFMRSVPSKNQRTVHETHNIFYTPPNGKPDDLSPSNISFLKLLQEDLNFQAVDKVQPRVAYSTKERENNENRDIRILREVSITQLLFHPNICKMYDVLFDQDRFYLISELVLGGQLLDYIVKRGRLTEDGARKLAMQIASALQYCHNNSIVHRDLKIENILLTKSGDIKIIDFGLANVYSSRDKLVTFCGSLYFAAPELLNAQPYIGPEADIWSFGVILFVLVCGRVPFDDPSMPLLHKKIKSGKFTMPQFLTKECCHLISRILTVDSTKRATMDEILNHKWMTNKMPYSSIFSMPKRIPLVHPQQLDPHVIQVMADYIGLGLGSEDLIKQSILNTLSSKSYRNHYRMVYKPYIEALEAKNATMCSESTSVSDSKQANGIFESTSLLLDINNDNEIHFKQPQSLTASSTNTTSFSQLRLFETSNPLNLEFAIKSTSNSTANSYDYLENNKACALNDPPSEQIKSQSNNLKNSTNKAQISHKMDSPGSLTRDVTKNTFSSNNSSVKSNSVVFSDPVLNIYHLVKEKLDRIEAYRSRKHGVDSNHVRSKSLSSKNSIFNSKANVEGSDTNITMNSINPKLSESLTLTASRNAQSTNNDITFEDIYKDTIYEFNAADYASNDLEAKPKILNFGNFGGQKPKLLEISARNKSKRSLTFISSVNPNLKVETTDKATPEITTKSSNLTNNGVCPSPDELYLRRPFAHSKTFYEFKADNRFPMGGPESPVRVEGSTFSMNTNFSTNKSLGSPLILDSGPAVAGNSYSQIDPRVKLDILASDTMRNRSNSYLQQLQQEEPPSQIISRNSAKKNITKKFSLVLFGKNAGLSEKVTKPVFRNASNPPVFNNSFLKKSFRQSILPGSNKAKKSGGLSHETINSNMAFDNQSSNVEISVENDSDLQALEKSKNTAPRFDIIDSGIGPSSKLKPTKESKGKNNRKTIFYDMFSQSIALFTPKALDKSSKGEDKQNLRDFIVDISDFTETQKSSANLEPFCTVKKSVSLRPPKSLTVKSFKPSSVLRQMILEILSKNKIKHIEGPGYFYCVLSDPKSVSYQSEAVSNSFLINPEVPEFDAMELSISPSLQTESSNTDSNSIVEIRNTSRQHDGQVPILESFSKTMSINFSASLLNQTNPTSTIRTPLFQTNELPNQITGDNLGEVVSFFIYNAKTIIPGIKGLQLQKGYGPELRYKYISDLIIQDLTEK